MMLGSEIFICAMHNLSAGCFVGASWVHGFTTISSFSLRSGVLSFLKSYCLSR